MAGGRQGVPVSPDGQRTRGRGDGRASVGAWRLPCGAVGVRVAGRQVSGRYGRQGRDRQGSEGHRPEPGSGAKMPVLGAKDC